jgi:hypothetical protein
VPSTYLEEGDYANYGVPSGTTAAQVTAASAIIDAYLKRPEGLVWNPDAQGNPAYMAAPAPALTQTTGSAIEPGSNVQVPVSGGIQALSVGEALILDRSNSEAVEAVAIASIQLTPPVLTLQSVVNAHSSGATLDKGLTILQHKFMPSGRPLTTLAYTPIMRLLSGQGRYGYDRRGAASRYQVDEFNLLASLSHFGGPPAWELFPISNTGVDPQSGQVWVPAGVMLAYYSEVNIWYVAGFQYANLPAEIKAACASLIAAALNVPPLGNVKSYKAGDTAITLFAASLLSDDMKAQLNPYRAKLFN